MNSIYIIGGPTASGKSARALEIAQVRNGVIINADAMQVYRELPILTAQPTAAEKQKAKHRLYGIIAASEPCSAGIWARWAKQEIEQCWHDNALPVIVGGTGLYLKALIEGFSPIPEINAGVRCQVSEQWQEMGAEKFHSMLMEKDPATASRLKPGDKQRHVRALEVLEATGKPLSHWQALPRTKPFARDCFEMEILTPPRDALYRRCDERFARMLEAGALEEVRTARNAHGNTRNDGFARAIGYGELCAHLEGDIPLDEAVLRAQQATRNYAKRQLTWFRHQLK